LLNSLVDTGANGSIFLNTACAIDVAKFFQTKVVRLKTPYQIKGYDGKSNQPVTHVIILHLAIDGRRFKNVPMIIANLGNHDMIIGRQWLDEKDIWLDVKNQRLLWPQDRPLEDKVKLSHELTIPRDALVKPDVDPKHQRDADRRDRKMENKFPIRILKREEPLPSCLPKEESKAPRYQPPRTQKMDDRANMNKMNRNLTEETRQEEKKPCKRVHRTDLPKIDIAAIGAVGFHRTAQKKNTEVFITSLYEIDKMIDEQRANLMFQDYDDYQKIVDERLPKQYKDFEDVFSRKDADDLSPHRPCDHKIQLTEPNNLGFSPLRKQSLAELEATREYLLDNLNKGFIATSNAPFASPILFALKPGGGLRFCVDYRKLNAITRKD
jgi:hypothetical protein